MLVKVMLWNTLGLYESVPLLLYGIWLTYATSLNVVSSFIVDRVGRVKLLASGLVSRSFRGHSVGTDLMPSHRLVA